MIVQLCNNVQYKTSQAKVVTKFARILPNILYINSNEFRNWLPNTRSQDTSLRNCNQLTAAALFPSDHVQRDIQIVQCHGQGIFGQGLEPIHLSLILIIFS